MQFHSVFEEVIKSDRKPPNSAQDSDPKRPDPPRCAVGGPAGHGRTGTKEPRLPRGAGPAEGAVGAG